MKTKDSKENIIYFLLDYSLEKPTLSEINFLDEEINNISFNPNNKNRNFLILKNQTIFLKRYCV